MSLKELNINDSRKLFEMLAGGAKPADVFDTFAPNDDNIDSIQGGVQFDPKDQDNIVYQAIRKLNGEIPESKEPPFDEMESQLPPGTPKIVKDLMRASPISAIATIKVTREGDIEGFGFSKTQTVESSTGQGNAKLGIADLIGKLTGSEGHEGPRIPRLPDLGELVGSLAQAVKSAANSPGEITEIGDGIRLKIGRISIKGGNGSPVNIGVEDVEVSAPMNS